MHMREQLILNFGPRTLSRIYCEACKEETLHVRGVCNHCTPQPNRSATDVRLRNRGRQSNTENPWRAGHEATCKVLMNVGHNED